MSILDWAKEEIEIAKAFEGKDTAECEFDYGCACYDSALKAFESLRDDGHSGMSIQITRNILNRLIDGKPLRPIEDIPEVWGDGEYDVDRGCTTYRCKRMSALFKYVYDDGHIEYWDVDRYYCCDINTGTTFTGGLARKIIHEMYPIAMPYWPTKPYKVMCEECLTNQANGDFDTVGILQIVEPTGEQIIIDRFFKEAETDFVEINKLEYQARLKMAEELENSQVKPSL